MLYDESTASSLRPWLVRTLQPICDADPEALADYVLALLKHDAAEPELRKMFVSQLEEFLEKEASKFVDALFSALRTKSYLPYEPIKSEPYEPIKMEPGGGIPIPLDALMSAVGSSDRGRKRSLDGNEHEHPPPKGPRLSGDGHFSRYPGSNGRHSRGTGNHHHGGVQANGRGAGRGEGSSMNGTMHGQLGNMDAHQLAPMYRPPGSGYAGRSRRGICRDYHNNGFCARGSLCQYSHGEDAVIPPMPYAPGPGIVNPMQAAGAPFMPMFGGGVPFGGIPDNTYDPHESHMEMGLRHGRGPRLQEGHGMHDAMPISSVELPVIQDLTPRDPVEEATRDSTIQPNGFTHNFGTPRRAPLMGMGHRGNTEIGFNGSGSGGHMSGGHMSSGSGFRRSGRGTFTGDNHTFRNGTRDDKTLVVEKIPEEKQTLEAVNDWFKRFGTVTNVAIDSPSAKALVSFSNHTEAHAAWKSEEAVFGNRFVKLFWHRPMEGHGGFGQRALAASAPLVQNIATVEEPSHPLQPELQPQLHPPSRPQQPLQPLVTSTPVKAPQKPDPAQVAALAARQQLLEKQISEQKVLMSRLATASTPEEKQEIMTRIRNIQSGVKPSTVVPSQPSSSKLSNGTSNAVLSEKERLDKELELHTVQSALRDDSEGAGDEATSTTALKEKLARLKAEASRLGVPEAEINADSSASITSPYRPYRGRGFRGRGFARGGMGRGGPPRSSMKLDNRPRKLIIQDVPTNDEAVQAVRNYYQNMGNLESFWNQSEGQVIAQFWSRTAAEHAFASGTEIPSVGKVKVSWYTGSTPSTPIATSTPSLVGPVPLEGKTGRNSDDMMNVETGQGEQWDQAYDDEDERRRRRSRSRSFS
ncbi:hypothetical protein K439DRAFT_1630837 [Ramaria rubella]|nr:hypothetical protein K439DRAFT_1630837 [Ramaria rubella]